MQCVRLLLLAVGLLFATAGGAADWDSCADDLDRLRRAARDATDIAERVKSAYDQAQSCRRDKSTYGCTGAASDYENEVYSLNSELDSVARRVRDVAGSCDMDIGSARRVAPPSSGNQTCDIMRRYVGRLPDAVLIETCKKSMTEAECRKCISGDR